MSEYSGFFMHPINLCVVLRPLHESCFLQRLYVDLHKVFILNIDKLFGIGRFGTGIHSQTPVRVLCSFVLGSLRLACVMYHSTRRFAP